MKTASSANHDDKRRASNQRNSQKSTGPKTEAGKRISAQNAVKHNLHSKKILLPGESAEELAEFHAGLVQALDPRNALEAHLVEQYIPIAWRLRGLPEIEAGIFVRYGISDKGNQCGPPFAMVASVQQDNILGELARYEATKRKAGFKILELLRALRKDEWEQAPSIEAEVIRDETLIPVKMPADPDAIEDATESLPPSENLAGDREEVPNSSGHDFFKSNANSGGEAELPEDKKP